MPQRLAVLAVTGPAATEFRCRGAPRDGRSPPTGRESEECRLNASHGSTKKAAIGRISMTRCKLVETIVSAGVLALWAGHANAEEFSARLNGFEELGALNNQTGAILSEGTGTVSLTLGKKAGGKTAGAIDYTVTQAHIHFGKARDSGGILVYFCTNLLLPATFTGPAPQPCPKNSGTVKGTFKAANVQAIAGQNVSAGDFDALMDAITS